MEKYIVLSETVISRLSSFDDLNLAEENAKRLATNNCDKFIVYEIKSIFPKKTQHVVIIKCENKKYWYFGRIGSVFEVEEFDEVDFIVFVKNNLSKFGGAYLIEKKDCKILD